MTMPSQQNGSAKRFLPYHNVLILHKSKNQTVKDQSEIETAIQRAIFS